MEPFKIRYGASLDFSVETDDATAQTVTLYVGLEGQLPVITSPATFDDDHIAYISVSSDDTKVPLNTYKYQLTVVTSDDKKYKYPTDEDCNSYEDLPDFVVLEALDETEIVS